MLENQNVETFFHTLQGRKLFIFGTGGSAKKTIKFCHSHAYPIWGVLDNNKSCWGSTIDQLPIYSVSVLNQFNTEEVVVLIASVYLVDIVNQLKTMNIKYIFSAHLCKMFPSRQLAAISQVEMLQVEKLKTILSDQKSVDLLERIVELRNTGENRLYEVFAGRQYYQQDIFDFSNEVFLDCGCYHGEEIDYLKSLQCGQHTIYAFEPDSINYAYLKEKYQDMQDVILMDCGVWKESGELCFHEKGTAGSTIIENGEKKIKVEAIDNIITERVTFIKMDIEGAELEAIEGARKTILKNMPKLAICIYHKNDDLWKIPLRINELSKEYEIFIRQHSLSLSDTVMYARPRGYHGGKI